MINSKKIEGHSNLSGWSKFTMNTKLIFGLTLTLFLTTISTAAVYVPADYGTIQGAIDAVLDDGNEVIVADGTYYEYDLHFNGVLITVRSENGPANCIIDCQGNGRGFSFDNSETPATVVQGFTIINGSADFGGAIECFEASPTIDNCIIKNNYADFGGAIDCLNASPVIINCRITNNYSYYDGGAIECGSESRPEITNCLIADNTSDGYGGAIDNYGLSQPVIINCTIVNNTGDNGFGGIYSADASVVIRNSILWNNVDDIYGSAAATYSCVQDGIAGTENINTDPLFRTGPLGNYYLSQISAGQLANSDCINRGMELADVIFGPGHSFTTRTDNTPDISKVDMGFHYPYGGPTLQYKLTTKADPNTAGTVNPNHPAPGQDYKQYTEKLITATAAGNYKLLRWIDANTATYNPLVPATYHTTPGLNNTFVITLNTDKTVIAEFSPTATYKLASYVIGGNGSIVNVDPNYYPDPNNPGSYFIPKNIADPNNTPVTITALPNPGYIVKQWIKGHTANFNLNDPNTYTIIPGPVNPLTTTIDANTTITVEFKYQQWLLTTRVADGNGTLMPKRGYYPAGTTVQLVATPADGNRVESWTWTGTGTAGLAINPGWNCNTNSILMDGNKTVTVKFQPSTSKLIKVLGDIYGIQNAVNMANNGDTIKIYPGTYVGTGFTINKILTIVGDPEHPENVIIDCTDGAGSNYGFDLWGDPLNPLNPCTLNGVTIINSRVGGGTVVTSTIPGTHGWPTQSDHTNLDSMSVYGAAVSIHGDHIVRNCIIRDCAVLGGRAGDGTPGGDPNNPNTPAGGENGGNGGWGGNVGGAGIYVDFGNPKITNILIENCVAIGGNSGNGATGFSEQEDFFDPAAIYYPPGTSGVGGYGGNAMGAGIYISHASNAYLTDVTVRNCLAIAGNGGNGADGAVDVNGADAGLPGRVKGAGIHCGDHALAVLVNCVVEDCAAVGGIGGNGGNGGADFPNVAPAGNRIGGYGGLTTITAAGQGDPKLFSANGGAVFCDDDSNALFTNCSFTGNATYGSISGLGGIATYGGQSQPRQNYRVPSAGAGVFCSTGSISSFSKCLFENNITAYNEDYNDPNRLGLINVAGISNYAGEYTGEGGGLCLWGAANANINDCNFVQNSAPLGGGIYSLWSAIKITDSNIINNRSYSGGGVMTLESTGLISKSLVKGNTAGTVLSVNQDSGYAVYGTGGGIYALSSLIDINDTTVIENSSNNIGGGICFDGDWWPQPTLKPSIKNCLITDNNAVEGGGGIAAIYLAKPTIQNCTIADNSTTDANGIGGGLLASYLANVTVKDTILWGNSGNYGSQIALSSDNSDMPSSLTITYSDIDLSSSSMPIYLDDTRCSIVGLAQDIYNIWFVEGGTNIADNPNFVSGYYLSHTVTGQIIDSACIDAGSALAAAVGMDTYTNRLDGGLDSDMVDMGFHYRQAVPQHNITVRIIPDIDNPTVYGRILNEPNSIDSSYDPNTLTYTYRLYEGMNLTLTAVSDANEYIKGWYDQSDNLLVTTQSYSLTVSSDATYFVRFKPRRIIHVPGAYPYTNIQQAIDDAENGDIIIIHSGNYVGTGFMVYNKDITITSTNPDDPCAVARTIIDCAGENGGGILLYGTGSGTCTLNGLTIINGHTTAVPALDGDNPGDNGGDGGSHAGQALIVYGNHNVLNCVIRNAYAGGGAAGNGADGDEDSRNGGRGGEGGDAFGAGILVYYGSPIIKNCLVEDCQVIGGNGGNGGNGNNDSDGITSGAGGRGGYAGRAYGAGIACMDGTSPTFENCTVRNCQAIAGQAGDGGNTGKGMGMGAYGGLADADPQQDEPTNHSAYGGGIFVGKACNATFTNCTIENNITDGSVSGQGGESYNGVQTPPHRNLNVASYGAGIYCDESSYTKFVKCSIQDNNTTLHSNYYVGYGGGLAIVGGLYSELTDCNLSSNSSNVGGGFYSTDLQDLKIDNSSIVDNISYIGGGLFTIYGKSDISDSYIGRNIAEWYGEPDDPNAATESYVYGAGGGLYSFATRAAIKDCHITENTSSGSGGGIYIGGESANYPRIVNCLITKNRANRDGGGISTNWFAATTVRNCTIAENRVTSADFTIANGGGIYGSYGSTTDVNNSILWGNIANEGSQIAVGSGDPAFPLISDVNITFSDIQDPNQTAASALDVVILIDTTGSMGGVLDSVKTAAADIVDRIAQNTSDYRIAVVDYRDFPIAPYGAPGIDYTSKDDIEFTTNRTAVQNAINAITLGAGADWEESVYSALMHCIDANSLGNWRVDDNVKKIIILMGDAPPHDPEPNTAYTLKIVTDAANGKNINIYSILTGGGVGNTTATSYFKSLAEDTSGVLIEAPDASTSSAAVIQAIDLATLESMPVYTENGCIINHWNAVTGWDDVNSNNIHEDPNFISGYYLSHMATDQLKDSNCIDAGSSNANKISVLPDTNMADYTTRIDGVFDANKVDMGYHYPYGVMKYEITVKILPDANYPGIHGSITANPNKFISYDANTATYTYRFYAGTIPTLTAVPNLDFYVKGWYDKNDARISIAKSLTFTADSNNTYFVRFKPARTISVSGGGAALTNAVETAENGDTLIVAAGTYTGDIDIAGKQLKLYGVNP
ncbi:MAG: right-handed parallel beta-helix repeat-containing protein, partial [Phycisphaerae bacterium]